jgi:hypothetical protein
MLLTIMQKSILLHHLHLHQQFKLH